MTVQFAVMAAVTTVVGAAMMRMGLRRRVLMDRNTRHCASCGRRLTARTCRRCSSA